jgi:hypothetical protein
MGGRVEGMVAEIGGRRRCCRFFDLHTSGHSALDFVKRLPDILQRSADAKEFITINMLSKFLNSF